MSPAWPWLKRGLTAAFFLGVGWLLFTAARSIAWGNVLTSVKALPLDVVAMAAGLAVASHTLFSCFDLLGRHYTGHTLRTRTVMGVNAISYAFNLNLGSLVGGVAFRYRLYSRLGLATSTITRVVSISMLTNWIGYTLLAGTAFLFWPLALPASWGVGPDLVRLLGAGLLAVATGYVLLCALRGGGTFTLRGHTVDIPGLRMAALQLAMSCTNWLLIATLVWTLLQGRVEFATTLQVLLIAAVAGVIAHVPAGLGVLEAVFVAILGDRLPMDELLAALLAYRGLYYVAPLAIAAVAYAATELRLQQRLPHA